MFDCTLKVFLYGHFLFLNKKEYLMSLKRIKNIRISFVLKMLSLSVMTVTAGSSCTSGPGIGRVAHDI